MLKSKMKHLLIITIFISAIASYFAFGAQGKTLTIGLDLSGSNPLLVHQHFADAASQYVTEKIETLKTGEKVRIKTFGARSNVENLKDFEVVVSRRANPKKIATAVTAFLKFLPSSKEKTGQASTNLIAWLEFTSGFDCSNNGDIVVVTDGLESSSLISGDDFINKKKSLPKADVSLSGCNVTFYGLGAGLPPEMVKHMRKSWRLWHEQAGADFDYVIK